MAASLIAVGAITTANPTPTGALANVLVFLSECSRLCVISPAFTSPDQSHLYYYVSLSLAHCFHSELDQHSLDSFCRAAIRGHS